MNFREKWNIIPIERWGKRPLIQWLPYKEVKYPRKDLFLHEPCNYAVICGKTSHNLVILDFDFEGKPNFKNIISGIKDKFPEIANTLIHTTPHGLHIFFYINSEVPPRQTQLKSPFTEIKHIDILGEGGYALVPPSQLEDGIYQQVFGEEPTTVDRDYFDNIVKFFVWREEDNIIQEYKKNKEIEINLNKFREPFKDILDGKIDIEKQAKKTGRDEFVYWKYLFIEALRVGYNPRELYDILRKTQPSFNVETTETQLKHHLKATSRRMNNNTIPLYFPDYQVEDQKEDWLIIAETLMDKFDLITMDDSEQLMVRKGNIYTFDLNEFYADLAYLLIEEAQGVSYRHKRSTIIQYIKDTTRFNRDNFHYDKWLINFKNGYFDVKGKRFIQQAETDKIFCYEIPHEYHGRTKCPKFKRYLIDWLGESNTIKPEDIFEMIGYSMTMNTGFKKAFFIYGGGNAGKTQFQNILEFIIGFDNRCSIPLQRLSKNEFGTEGLQFKLLNMIGDMSYSTIEDLSAFKMLTGGDRHVPAEIKGGRKFQFRNMVKIWYNANYIPRITNEYDEAFYLRWILINFPNVFPEDAEGTIPDLGELLCNDLDEIAGILYESVKGAKRLHERGHFRSEIVENTEHIWRYNSDDLYAFLDDNCIIEQNSMIDVIEFNRAYNRYLHQHKKRQLSSFKIGESLQAYGIFKERESVGEKREYYYDGVGWKIEEETKIRQLIPI